MKSEEDLLKFFIQKRKNIQDNIEGLRKAIFQQFSNLFNAYAKAYNKMYERNGSLFQTALKRKTVEEESYFTKLIHYIHANPVHHGFTESIENWRFSSY